MSRDSTSTYHKAHQINQFGITGQGFQNPILDHRIQRCERSSKNEKITCCFSLTFVFVLGFLFSLIFVLCFEKIFVFVRSAFVGFRFVLIPDRINNKPSDTENDSKSIKLEVTDPNFADTLPLPVTDCFNDSIYLNKGNDGSYTKLITIQKKHIRHEKNPNELYDIPLTDNQKYGWHQPENTTDKNGNEQKQTKRPWYQCDRAGRKNSPMTKFVDDMALTNREFSLF